MNIWLFRSISQISAYRAGCRIKDVPEDQGEQSLRATIKSIARDLGISHMTVSRALSGNPNVSEQTRKLIEEHAARTGYIKSQAATAIRGGPTNIVGLLLPNIINDFYARFANAFASLCAREGFDLVIHLTNDDHDLEAKSVRRLQALQARAVIRVPAPIDAARVAIEPDRLPLINLIRERRNGRADGSILIDDGPAIGMAVRHLVSRGRRRIAYLGAAETLSSGRDRLAAFRKALTGEGGAKWNQRLVQTGPPGYEMGRAAMATLLDGGQAPDALVCGGFEISNGALSACLDRGLRMPDDIAFVGYGDPAFYRWIAGGISTIGVPETEVAECAIARLLALPERPRSRQDLIATKLILRCSA